MLSDNSCDEALTSLRQRLDCFLQLRLLQSVPELTVVVLLERVKIFADRAGEERSVATETT